MWLIIGSVAAKHWFPEWGTPFDIDVLSPSRIKGGDGVLIDTSWNSMGETIISQSADNTFADPDTLLTLKLSHAHWDIKWEKTMFDINAFVERGCQIKWDLYHQLVEMWKTVHGEKRINLNMGVDEFWNDSVKRIYVHDSLHELVKFGPQPIHELIRKDLTNVMCDEHLFLSLTHEQQLQCVMEEMLVIAIERAGLTSKSSKIEIRQACSKALKALCVKLSTGWFSTHCLLSHATISKQPNIWLPQIYEALRNLDQAVRL